MKVAAYLNFEFEAEAFIIMCKDVLGAEIMLDSRFEDGMADDPNLLGKIFHAELKIADLNLYVADTGVKSVFSSTKFVVETQNKEQAETFLIGLSKDGKLISDLQKMPYGPTIGTVEDKFGITWDIVVC